MGTPLIRGAQYYCRRRRNDASKRVVVVRE
jgi:hypothetical protein